MKTNRIIILLGLMTFFLISCLPKIRFEEPQPEGKKDLSTIPRYYQGEYIRLSDSTSLFIKENIIYWEWSDSIRISKYEMKEEFDTIFEQDTELEFSPNSKIYFKIVGDSAFINFYGIDTIFILDESNILRKYKGYLFLNHKKGKNSWKVELLKLENGFLDIKDLVSVSEIDSLKEVININTVVDTSTDKVKRYVLSPKKRELKEILESKKIGKTYKKQ